MYNWDLNASARALARERQFIRDGWLMLREIDPNGEPVQTYLWGLDLAGLGGAGILPVSAGGPASGQSSGGAGVSAGHSGATRILPAARVGASGAAGAGLVGRGARALVGNWRSPAAEVRCDGRPILTAGAALRRYG
ncbi:MAG: hypothetical protein IPM13_06060 [Phycisphaerales bacterium]|nr:hypothetical protein [Phycisphaerales bacterium]